VNIFLPVGETNDEKRLQKIQKSLWNLRDSLRVFGSRALVNFSGGFPSTVIKMMNTYLSMGTVACTSLAGCDGNDLSWFGKKILASTMTSSIGLFSGGVGN